MRRRSLTLVFLSLLLTTCLCTAQQLSKKMTNKDVIDLVGLGLPDDLIIDKIQSADATNFDTSVAGLKALKGAKVSNEVIRAMINPHAAPASTAAAPPAPAATTEDAPAPAEPEVSAPPPPMVGGLPKEVGVYVLVKNRVKEVDPELVGWQTGGVLKTIGTLGLDKGHVNGKVANPKSPLQLHTPVVFVIKTPEGTSATEYQLLHLDLKDNRREFRAMTGGVIHASGGAEKNATPFEPHKVGDRVWRIDLSSLPKGEYGFLPPGISSASISSSGKIYSFGIVE
jgi:hypothetical protein